jgi:hypothetical protein
MDKIGHNRADQIRGSVRPVKGRRISGEFFGEGHDADGIMETAIELETQSQMKAVHKGRKKR